MEKLKCSQIMEISGQSQKHMFRLGRAMKDDSIIEIRLIEQGRFPGKPVWGIKSGA